MSFKMNHKGETVEMTPEKIQAVQEKFKPGMRIKLGFMDDDYAVPQGTTGTVVCVDSVGSICMKWDNGSSLSLFDDIDEFEIIEA